MKKTISSIITVVLLTAVASYADAATFLMSATMPSLTGVSYTVSWIDGSVTPNKWTVLTGTTLNFGTLYLKTNTDGSQIYKSDMYFAIDVAGTGGVGVPTSTQVSYVEGSTGTTKLGARANVSFASVAYVAATATAAATSKDNAMTAHAKKALSALTTTETIAKADITGAGGTWLRIYLGLNDGATTGMLPFTAADAAGTYTGTLTVTSTL